jgi:hypothetical protein
MPIKAISENRNGKQGEYLEVMKKEFDYAMEVEMPEADGKHSLAKISVTFQFTLTDICQIGPRSTFRRSFKCS